MKRIISTAKKIALSSKYSCNFKKIISEQIPIIYLSELSKLSNNPYSKIDDKYNIVFVHVPKTAGTAIYQQFFGLQHHGHYRPEHYYRFDKSEFLNRKKIAVVRNPWDKFISAYHYIDQNVGGGVYANRFKKEFFYDVNSFAQFKEKFLGSKGFRNQILKWDHFRPQWDFITLNNDYCIDTLGRFEELDNFVKDFKLYIKDININSLEKNNFSKRSTYKDYYCDSLMNAVGELYRKEIDLLGYSY